jgi:beta-glucosidase
LTPFQHEELALFQELKIRKKLNIPKIKPIKLLKKAHFIFSFLPKQSKYFIFDHKLPLMLQKVFSTLLLLFFFFEPALSGPRDSIETKIDLILSKMSLEEKIGQTSLRGTSSRSKGLSEELKAEIRKGKVGAILNLTDPLLVLEIQKIAVEESPQHIPLLFGRDVVHGYKTIFPIPLALAASWDLSLVEESSIIAAAESYSRCINWTFAPMADICHDPRWGRIAESPGEDPYLASKITAAYIKGFQGEKNLAPGRILACAKHFAAYGAAEGGRDYNTVSMSEQILRDIYLKPFHAAVKADAATFMTSFNDLNGIPSSGNPFLLKQVLRNEWQFSGFVVSDWNSVTEMIAHGYCEDEKDAALKASTAGLDMEMTSRAYEFHLKSFIESGKLSFKDLDEMVRNILRIKMKSGIFENPYFKERETFQLLAPNSLALAKKAAIKSCVLLKNEKSLLPLSSIKKVAVIGPMANAPKEQLGTWIFDGDKKDSQTPLLSIQNELGTKNVLYAPGLLYSREKSKEGFAKAIEIAQQSEVIIFFAGEEAILSGEAHSRADINLPGAQEELILELAKTGKPIVLVIMAGRPITIQNILPHVSSVLIAWHPGTMAGPAISDLLFGKTSPSGKLPVTWPKTVGQIPIYYNHTNTGRPTNPKTFVPIDSIPLEAWQSSLGNNSHYLDAGYTPQYPFGYGLSYTNFSYSSLSLHKTIVNNGDSLYVTVEVSNAGKVKGIETIQLYIQDLTGSLVRPVKELKAFTQIEFLPGEKKKISFAISTNELGFYNQQMNYVTEPGKFKLWVGPDSDHGLVAEFEIK